MQTEREKLSKVRRMLEPLAVLYTKAIVEARKRPEEVRLTIRQSPDLLSENPAISNLVHIVSGETLWAAHEAWLDYQRIESELIELDGVDVDRVNGHSALEDEPACLSADEREWLEWFYHLTDEDKGIVEACGEADLSVTPDNFGEMKRVLLGREAEG